MLLKRKQRRTAKHSEGSWAVSYVDMLTLLLCFFIIFYNNNQHGEENLLQKIAFDLSGKTAKGDGTGTGTGNGTGGIGNTIGTKAGGTGNTGAGNGTGTDFGVNLWGKATSGATGNVMVTPEDLALLELIKAKLKTELPADIKTGERSLEINFDGISFFEAGKTKLLPTAQVQVEKVINLLSKYKDVVRVTVQGHTDPSKLSAKRQNFSDNWELSVLRATSVLKLFVKNGYSQELLSAEGFADTRLNRNVAEISKDDFANLRRITLRIEPMQVKK
jgi:chemotaxis protein MotB